jgi:hypothetical protein
MIWIISGGWDHEGSEVLGVFSTEEKARAFVVAMFSRDMDDLDRDLSYDFLLLQTGLLDPMLEDSLTGGSYVFDKRTGLEWPA